MAGARHKQRGGHNGALARVGVGDIASGLDHDPDGGQCDEELLVGHFER